MGKESRSESRVTTDHGEIRKWVEERGGRPAEVKGTGQGDDAGLLKIDFNDGPEPKLEEISWDEFFQKFEEKKLALQYQEQEASGQESRFARLIRRDEATDRRRK